MIIVSTSFIRCVPCSLPRCPAHALCARLWERWRLCIPPMSFIAIWSRVIYCWMLIAISRQVHPIPLIVLILTPQQVCDFGLARSARPPPNVANDSSTFMTEYVATRCPIHFSMPISRIADLSQMVPRPRSDAHFQRIHTRYRYMERRLRPRWDVERETAVPRSGLYVLHLKRGRARSYAYLLKYRPRPTIDHPRYPRDALHWWFLRDHQPEEQGVHPCAAV